MKMNENQLREYVRNKVRDMLQEKRSKSQSDGEAKVRQAIREAIQDILQEKGEKGRLDESVMGMTGMPAVNPANSFTRSNDGNENFSYDPNAVSDMAQRDRQRSQSQGRMVRTDSDHSGSKMSREGGNTKTGYEKSGNSIIFENQQTNDRVSLWIEGNQLVCEYKSSENGTQKTKLSEEKTKDVIEDILRDNFQM